MRRKLILCILLSFVYGCTTLSYYWAKAGKRKPNRYAFRVSNPLWSTDSKKVYFLLLEIPCQYGIYLESGFESLQHFPFIFQGYRGKCEFDPKRNVVYKLIQLDTKRKKNVFSVLLEWQLKEKAQPFIDTFLRHDADTLILHEHFWLPKEERYTVINVKELNKEVKEKIIPENKIYKKRRKLGYGIAMGGKIYSPDKNKYVKLVGDFITIFNATGEMVSRIHYKKLGLIPSKINTRFSPDSSKLLLFSPYGRILIFDIEKRRIYQYSIDTSNYFNKKSSNLLLWKR